MGLGRYDSWWDLMTFGPVPSSSQLIASKAEGKAYSATAADVWACGVMLFAMMLGRFPYDHVGHPDPNSSGAHVEVGRGRSRCVHECYGLLIYCNHMPKSNSTALSELVFLFACDNVDYFICRSAYGDTSLFLPFYPQTAFSAHNKTFPCIPLP